MEEVVTVVAIGEVVVVEDASVKESTITTNIVTTMSVYVIMCCS